MYVNLLTNELIPDENVINESNNGLSFYIDNCWHLLAKGQYQDVSDTNTVNVSYIPASVNDAVINSSIDPGTVNTEELRFYTHYFGFNNVSICNKLFAETSAITSDSIAVLTGTPLTLTAKTHFNENSNIEFYVIDGFTETPILPKEITKIEHEKRFIGLPSRFNGTDFIYYKNKKETDKNDIAIDDSLYTVSYIPTEDSHYYTPSNPEIKIKIILRLYEKDAAAPYVENVTIKQEI